MSDAMIILLTTLAAVRTLVLDTGTTWTITGVGEATAIGPWRADAGSNVRHVRVIRVTARDVVNKYSLQSDCGGKDCQVRYTAVLNSSSDGHNLERVRNILGTYVK